MYFSTMHPLWSTSANLLCYWTSTSTNPCCPLAPGWTPCLPFSLDCRWVIRNLSCFTFSRENPNVRALLLSVHLQVLKGDIRPAIETHEMLYQVTKKHNFLPEVDPLFFLSVFSISSMSVVYKLFLTLAHPLTYCLTRPSPLISGFTGLSTPSGQSLQKAPTSSIRYRGVTELSTKSQYNIFLSHHFPSCQPANATSFTLHCFCCSAFDHVL